MPKIVKGEETLQQTVPSENTFSAEENAMNAVAQDQNVQMPSAPAGMIATPTIVNDKVPVVAFVGPPSSGKSMILVRLAKYLREEGYTIKTDPTFLNTKKYAEDCEEFNDKLHTNIALKGTVEFLLVNVYDKNGIEVAKLLEAPGEDFYTTDQNKIQLGKNSKIEPYLATIMTSKNPKSYVMLLDLDSEISFRNDSYHRDSYAQRLLDHFLPKINMKRDRIVLLYNKIDMTPFGTINGCHNYSGAKEDAKMYYKQIFAKLRGGLFNLEQFAFNTFCTGMFSDQYNAFGEKYQTYNIADNVYPRDLWKEIVKKW